MDPLDAQRWMQSALELARLAADLDEVPVGAVVVHEGICIGADHDRRVELNDPTAHAEVLALRQAAAHLGDWRLENCALIVTLEPCPMCAGAALLARVPLIIYGARNPKFGAIESQVQMLAHTGWNHAVETVSGVLELECGDVMKKYFQAKRG